MIMKIAITMIAVFLGFPIDIDISTADSPSSFEDSFNFGSISINPEIRKRNPAFSISVESVLRQLREKQEIILIDVRDGKDFEKFRIPGSINIPVFAVKTKAFLKNKPLVLINEGYNNTKLEKECRRLRDSGCTKVWVMNGGLNFWRQKGGPLQGDVFAQKELNTISPRTFFAERNFEDWLVIDVSESRKPEALYLMPQGIHVPFSSDPTRFRSELKKGVDKHKNHAFLLVLIFNEDGRQYKKIEKVVNQSKIKNVFYLKGGLQGYKKFLQKQALIRQPTDSLKKTLRKCARCP